MSTANQTDHVRISCDTRWQPAADPVDSRYVGELKGHGEKKFGLSKAGQVCRSGAEKSPSCLLPASCLILIRPTLWDATGGTHGCDH